MLLTPLLCSGLLGVVTAQFEGWGEGRRDSEGDHGRANQPRGNSFGIPGVNETYDYIVVGGGTAGITLAARLAEDSRNFSVAIIEAGGFYEFENGNLTEIPGYNGWSTHIDETRPSLVEWDIETTPQVVSKSSLVAGGTPLIKIPGLRRAYDSLFPRTNFGCSAINSLGYQRGTIGYHKMWVDAVGDEAWSWENTLPFYKRSCDFTPPDMDRIGSKFDIPYDKDAFSDHGGPLRVSYGNYRGEYVAALAKSFQRLGLKKLEGLNSGSLIGYGAVSLTIDPETQVRSSSETSFLQAAMRRTSIKIYPHTLAKRIRFDEQKRARGVLASAMGQADYDFVLSARKEVVVSAGVFRSPQLLMASGIGPRETLAQQSIPVVSELAGVGQNLWDQPYIRLTFRVNTTTMTQMEDPEFRNKVVESYIRDQSGPLASNNAGELIGWEKIPEPYRSKLRPDTLAHLATFPADFPELELLPFGGGAFPKAHVASPETNYMTFAVGLLTPRSRGNVTITSGDTREQPLVNPNFFSDPIDVDLAVQAVLRAREWASKTGIIVRETDPGIEVQTPAQIRAWLKQAGALVFHGMSTCSMGKATDPRAVLDSGARVLGVRGLRVADSSSAPLLGPGHPMASVCKPSVHMLITAGKDMIAEKVAALILSDVDGDKPKLKGSNPVHSEL
ncbi:hypothetical protein QTJ16_005899 [Diplocarpon rosae]|uniref:Uncharacterized protein n=1 Tax=Diplocarpon rosae TaxID=946125 RepID=A0AAD9WCU7_9HELO|nr:hypothetical protein QTJ16_005899 [Diplocarpon rosae]